jgi:hypothetical protein
MTPPGTASIRLDGLRRAALNCLLANVFQILRNVLHSSLGFFFVFRPFKDFGAKLYTGAAPDAKVVIHFYVHQNSPPKGFLRFKFAQATGKYTRGKCSEGVPA